MRALSKAAILFAAVAFTQVASATCYMVYAPDNSVVFRSLTPPVDLSKQLHMTMPAAAPGGTLVFSPEDEGCQFESDKLSNLRQAASMPGKERRRAERARKSRRSNGA